MNNWKFFAAALILAAGLVGSALLISKFYLSIRHEQSISVKGYAEQDVVSDFGRLTCRVSARAPDLPDAHAGLSHARAKITARLKELGFDAGEIASGTIDLTKIARRDAQGKETNETEYYNLSQSLTIESANVVLINSAAVALGDLIRENIDLTVFAPAYFVSGLDDIKINLLAQATEDGCRRARTMAENSGARIGDLTSAGQGVFQITRRNSTDVSSYGIYDESTIEKTVKAIVSLSFEINQRRRAGD